MPITQEQLNLFKTWAAKKGITMRCELCGRDQWSSGDIVSAPSIRPDGGINLGGPGVPMLQIVCQNCGNIRLFAAVPIGLVS